MALSLATLRARLKERHERGGLVSSPGRELANSLINDSLREVCNTLGDQAYFLRKTDSLTLAPPPSTVTVPATMRRLYRLEDQAQRPGRQIDWWFLRHNADLSFVILTPNGIGVSTAHFLSLPQDLVLDADEAAVPDEYCELVVTLACQRLAETFGNAKFADLLTVQIERLWLPVKRDCQRYAGQRREAMQQQQDTSHPAFPW